MRQVSAVIQSAIPLVLKAVIQSARWVAVMRRCAPSKLHGLDGDEILKENAFLRDELAKSKDLIAILRRQLEARKKRRQATTSERLAILWHMEYLGIPRRQASKYFCIARSTLYRWIENVAGRERTGTTPANKTPTAVIKFVWEVARAMPCFGKLRIAQQMALLSIFVSASTVRNILNRPEPTREPKKKPCPIEKKSNRRRASGIVAEYPNHVWSADLTTVNLWGIWPAEILVVIDHFSRKLIEVIPLRSRAANPVMAALARAIDSHGPPRHLVTDHGTAFTSNQLKKLLAMKNIDHVLGAVGQHGSVARTERAIGELKREWFRRVFLIRGFGHLAELCKSALCWHNDWRPHQALSGNRPSDVYRTGLVARFDPADRTKFKSVPPRIESVQFAEPRTTAWRLERSA